MACRTNVVHASAELDWTRNLIWPTNIEVHLVLEEAFKADEVAFYKNLVHRNCLKHEVDARLMTYRVSKARVPKGPHYP